MAHAPAHFLRTSAGPRHLARRRRGALAAFAAVLALLAASLTFDAPAHAAPGSSALLLEDDFLSPTTHGSRYISGGNGFKACLTAGTDPAASPIPGCKTAPAIDAAGAGALRLTNTGTSRAGFLVYDKALPTRAGLDITFNQYQYGGTSADGIAFFLTDGSKALSAVGAYGGSLGYHNNSTSDGVANALLGIGFDVYGNFTVETNDTATCGTSYISGTAANHKSTVAVRGPGNARSGYCLLGAPVSTTSVGAVNLHSAGSTRPAPIETHIVIDPPAVPDPQVRVYLDGILVTTVDEPALLASTPTFKFGWAASTGGSTDNHEINVLTVKSVDPLPSDLSVSSSTPAPAPAGNPATVTWTPATSDASGPVPAGEPVTMTATAPPGTTFTTPGSPDWVCISTPTTVTCTYTSPAAIPPGTDLPPLSVTVVPDAGLSGVRTLTATVSSEHDDPSRAVDNTLTTPLTWAPVVAALSATPIVASMSPTAVTLDPDVIGTGPFQVLTTAPLDPAPGSVTVSSAQIVLTPAAGASGRFRATYQVSDVDGVPSGWAAVSLDVLPVARSGAVATDAGVPVSLTPGTPIGTGPFVYQAVTPGPELSGVTVVDTGAGPRLTLTPAPGFSGSTTIQYSVTDAAGLTSALASIDLTVRPAAGTSSLELWLDENGDANGSVTLPTPTGTGPFTFILDSDPSLATGTTATLSGTGVLSVQVSGGPSGAHVAQFHVQGAGAVSSTTKDVPIDIHPYLAPVPDTSGTTGGTLTAPAPTVVGTGPFTWAIAGDEVTGGAAHVNPSTGAVTFDTGARSGIFSVTLTGTDTAGLNTTSRTVTFRVSPLAHATSGDSTASATPSPVTLTPTAPAGSALSTVIVAGPASNVGVATVNGHELVITPAAGFSGPIDVTYLVDGADGLVSAPVTSTLRVHPAGADATTSMPAGASVNVLLPTPTGSGPFTWSTPVLDVPAAGTVTIVGGVATVTSSSSWSGTFTATYHVADAAGLDSADVQLRVTVVPVAPPAGVGSTNATGATGVVGHPVTSPAPAPQGSGPFTFELVTGPTLAQGVATIDEVTGEVLFTPLPGFSGRVTLTYVAYDVNGTPTPPAPVDFILTPLVVDPAAPPVGAASAPERTNASTPRTVVLGDPVGSAPFTYEMLTPPAPGDATATLDPDTGKLVVTPVAGFSGKVSLTYRVADADGISSNQTTVWVDIAPVAAPASVTTRAGVTASVTPVTPVGTGPFTWKLVTAGSPAQGTATMDPQTGRVTFVPAAGFVGQLDVRYVVTDAAGVVSDEQTVHVQVLAAMPVTGANTGALLAAAGALVAGGAGLLLIGRRRTRLARQ